MSTAPAPNKKTSFADIFSYSIGDGANSLVMNTFFGFAMLYYTKALGMSGTFAGLAMFVMMFWDAITDPLMGHITDNTKSRFGRRHPYMLVGGVLTILCFYAVWAVPEAIRAPRNRVMAASGDGTFQVWNANSGEQVDQIPGIPTDVPILAFGDDGEKVLSAGQDGVIRLWDAESGEEVRSFGESGDPVSALAFSRGGEKAVSAGEDGKLRIWDVDKGEQTLAIDAHDGPVSTVAFTPDVKKVLSVGDGNDVRLWLLETGEEVQSFPSIAGDVSCVAFSPNSEWVAIGHIDGTFLLREIENDESIKTVAAHEGPVHALAFSPNGRWLASGGADGALKLWHPKTGEAEKPLLEADGAVHYADFSRDSGQVIAWSEDGTLNVSDVATGETLQSFSMPARPGFIALISTTQMILWWYLLAMNLLLRTGNTIFGVPYIALGFEVCTDYNQRTTLQGMRTGVNMVVNLLGPAILVWSVFLRERDGIKGEGVAQNYQHMAMLFSAVALLMIVYVVFATRKYAYDSRNHPDVVGNSLRQILQSLKEVLFDPYPRTVFIFIAVLFIGVVFVTSLQMFIYVDFMEFESWEKSLVHGSTMVAAAFGALLSSTVVKRFDKKPAIYRLLLGACFGNVVLVLLFATGWVPKDLMWRAIPLATIIFLLFHSMYHLGSTAATTVANSMMADISEISRYRTGRLRDGSYSAMLSFVLKVAISVGLFLCGLLLDAIGVDQDAEHQTPEVARRLLYTAFLGGTAITLLAMAMIARYPVNREYMESIKLSLDERPGLRTCPSCGEKFEEDTDTHCPSCGQPVTDNDPPPPDESANA